jgi:hypothetical protein
MIKCDGDIQCKSNGSSKIANCSLLQTLWKKNL